MVLQHGWLFSTKHDKRDNHASISLNGANGKDFRPDTRTPCPSYMNDQDSSSGEAYQFMVAANGSEIVHASESSGPRFASTDSPATSFPDLAFRGISLSNASTARLSTPQSQASSWTSSSPTNESVYNSQLPNQGAAELPDNHVLAPKHASFPAENFLKLDNGRFGCPICPRDKFSSIAKARSHIATYRHTYVCPKCHCQWSYDTSKDLRRHMRGHDQNIERFQCPHEECASRKRRKRTTFSRKDLLERHLRLFHAAKDGERDVEDDVTNDDMAENQLWRT